MAATKLKKVAKERNPGYFWEILDLGSVRSIEIFPDKVDDCDQRNAGGLGGH